MRRLALSLSSGFLGGAASAQALLSVATRSAEDVRQSSLRLQPARSGAFGTRNAENPAVAGFSGGAVWAVLFRGWS
jgi:hypothetical protein